MRSHLPNARLAGILVTIGAGVVGLGRGCDDSNATPGAASDSGSDGACVGPVPPAQATVLDGQKIFRFDTFGDEAYWGDTLKLHQVIAGQANGGIGAGVSPKAALAVGLKVDADALPPDVVAGVKGGTVNLDNPATTLALLKLDAVLGVKGIFDSSGAIKSVGIECALCHSTVDDSFAPGIGARLDGWPNRDLDVGAIVNLSPDLTALATFLGVDQATVRAVLKAWGPGRFDAELQVDGRATRPDGTTGATLIPPAFGLAGVNLHTYTGWGSVPYWNAFVAILEMHGQGNFFDPRLDDPVQFPVAAKNQSGHVTVQVDLVSSKLPALQAYELSLPAPTPPAGSFDAAAAQRGSAVFSGPARCASCHTDPLKTESGWGMHAPAEIGIDDFQATRSPGEAYRTTPLRGLWSHQKGGFYHDGRFATLLDVVNHYDATFTTGLTDAQKADLIEYLKSI